MIGFSQEAFSVDLHVFYNISPDDVQYNCKILGPQKSSNIRF